MHNKRLGKTLADCESAVKEKHKYIEVYDFLADEPEDFTAHLLVGKPRAYRDTA